MTILGLALLALSFLQVWHGALMLEHHHWLCRRLRNGVRVSIRLRLVLVELHLTGNALDGHLDPLLVDWNRGLLLQRWPWNRLLLREQLRRERALTHLLVLFVFHQLLGLL